MSEKKDLIPPYGFKANLHLKASDMPTDLMGMDKVKKEAKIRLNMTIKSVLTFVLASFFQGIVIATFLISNTVRAKYFILPSLFLFIGNELILSLILFVDNTSTNSLTKAIIFLGQQVDSFSVRIGKSKKFKEIGIDKIRNNGYIEFSNGDIGKIYLVDGYTSRTLFPEEIERLEEVSTKYHKGRDRVRTTTEVKISSSKLQSAEEQIAAQNEKIRNAPNQAIKDICFQQRYILTQEIHNIRFTIAQHIILRDASLTNLEKADERLVSFAIDRGYYYNLRQLSQGEAIKLFHDIYNFK